MKKTVIVFLHFGYWLLYFLLLAIMLGIDNIQSEKTPQPSIISFFYLFLLFFIPNIFSFYSFYFFLFSRFLAHRKILGLILFGTVVCSFSAILGCLISIFIYEISQPVFSDPQELFNLNLILFLIAAIHGGIALVIRGFVNWFDEIKLKEEIAAKNYETEIALLKSQINPHFLFNTINNIDVLITKDTAKASQYLNQLSDILRYMVYETKSEKVGLKTELSYIEKYLELQKIRTSNPNYVNFEIIGEPKNLQIAPMIFFPFIENAFKHTENDKKSNSININILIMENSVKFECKNTYQKVSLEKQDYGGLGNELIQKRLELLYPNKHSLKIDNNDGTYAVRLSIDADS